MSSAADTLSAMLKAHGYSVTKPRLAVFEQLLDQEPLSMYDLVQKLPETDRASVYRTVALFEELGIVIRINIGWKYKLELSEAFTSHHHHMSCLNCKKIIPINESALEQVISQLGIAHGFTITAHQIELQGYCKACRLTAKG